MRERVLFRLVNHYFLKQRIFQSKDKKKSLGLTYYRPKRSQVTCLFIIKVELMPICKLIDMKTAAKSQCEYRLWNYIVTEKINLLKHSLSNNNDNPILFLLLIWVIDWVEVGGEKQLAVHMGGIQNNLKDSLPQIMFTLFCFLCLQILDF